MKIRVLKNNNGASMVVFTIAITVMLGMVALVTDVGLMEWEKQKLQNAIDSATLAAAAELPNQSRAVDTANHYITLNGYSLSDINITTTSDSVNIIGNKNVNFYFARIFGKRSANTVVESTALADQLGQAFDYALFSGSQIEILVLNGAKMTITGDVHSNKSVIVNGSKLTITGTCEAIDTVTTNGTGITIGETITNATYIPMPDFSDQIKVDAQQNGTYFQGGKTYDGANVNVDGSIYAAGNITVNSSSFNGKGCIVAEGDIIFNGSNLYNSGSDAVCFYSKNGDIIVNGSNAELNGIVYAPNGRVLFNGSNQIINGRAIADTITFNGSSLSLTSQSNDILSLPLHGSKLIK